MPFDAKDYLIMGGLGALGIGSWLYGDKLHRDALNRSLDLDKAYSNSPNYTPPAKSEYQKLRDIAGLDTNIASISKADIKRGVDTNNAFFIQNSTPGSKGRPYLAKKTQGTAGTVLLGTDDKSLATLAHELGHAKNYVSGELTDRMGKKALSALVGTITGVTSGFAARSLLKYLHGTKRLSDEAYNYWNIAPSLFGGLVGGSAYYLGDTYALKEEEAASKNALKYLKEYGHKGKDLKEDRKRLDSALDTYRTLRKKHALRTLGIGLGVGGFSYGLSKWLTEHGY